MQADDMSRRIRLRGRHAIGKCAFTIVDADVYAELNQYAWKAKPNGSDNNVYAVRNVRINGRYVTVRMHRVVLGYGGKLDIDHINGDPLDNRRRNLRIATRSENVRNRKVERHACVCVACGTEFEAEQSKGAPIRSYCSEACIKAAARKRVEVVRSGGWRDKVCEHCAVAFLATAGHQRFCSAVCRDAAKYRRKQQSGSTSHQD